jgi:hypothetical protein
VQLSQAAQMGDGECLQNALSSGGITVNLYGSEESANGMRTLMGKAHRYKFGSLSDRVVSPQSSLLRHCRHTSYATDNGRKGVHIAHGPVRSRLVGVWDASSINKHLTVSFGFRAKATQLITPPCRDGPAASSALRRHRTSRRSSMQSFGRLLKVADSRTQSAPQR